MSLSGPATVGVGQVFNVDLNISTDQEVFGFQFDLAFPSALVNVIGVTEQGFFAANGCCFLFDTPDNTIGTVTNVLDAIIGTPGLTGSDTLVTFQFVATGLGDGTISLQNVILSDENTNAITVDTINNADFSVITPEPSTAMFLALGAAPLLFLLRRRHPAQTR
jgi:hypothetical protein